jgi:hypothetical protein
MLNAFDLVNAKSALDKRYRANSAQRPRLVSTETSLRNALAVVAARHQSAKDLAVFLDAPSPDTPNLIPISHGKIVAQLGVALRDLVMAEGSMEWVLALEGEDALLVLDALQLVRLALFRPLPLTDLGVSSFSTMHHVRTGSPRVLLTSSSSWPLAVTNFRPLYSWKT